MDFNPNVVSTPRQDGYGHPSPYNSPTRGAESGYTSPPLAGGQFNRPQSPYASPALPPPPQGDPAMFSPRHDAIYLIVGRVMFQFWNKCLVNPGTEVGGTPPIVSFEIFVE